MGEPVASRDNDRWLTEDETMKRALSMAALIVAPQLMNEALCTIEFLRTLLSRHRPTCPLTANHKTKARERERKAGTLDFFGKFIQSNMTWIGSRSL